MLVIPKPITRNHTHTMSENAAAPTKPTHCNCWHQTDEKLNEKGFRLDRSMMAFKTDFTLIYQLPLQRADGSKIRRSDPQGVTMSFCPFCGQALP